MANKTEEYQQLHEQYHERVYSLNNVLDGVFRGMMVIYERMYGRFMPKKKNARIADLACGAGQFLKYLLNKGYYDITGVDISKGQVAYAKEVVTPSVQLMDAFEYLDHNKAHDLIVANDFIEHLTKARGIELVGKIMEALKPGGRVLIKTGNMAAFGGLVIWCNGLDHECGYTERSLQSLLGIWGFEQIEIIPYKERRRLYNWSQAIFHFGLRLMFKYFYGGNYPKCYSKIIAVTGVRAECYHL
tara:strand:+ start:13243 stop:13974 length:732 start_codon:yes stop_codon:yes gene_type:complete